jgi:hypothetical protein
MSSSVSASRLQVPEINASLFDSEELNQINPRLFATFNFKKELSKKIILSNKLIRCDKRLYYALHFFVEYMDLEWNRKEWDIENEMKDKEMIGEYFDINQLRITSKEQGVFFISYRRFSWEFIVKTFQEYDEMVKYDVLNKIENVPSEIIFENLIHNGSIIEPKTIHHQENCPVCFEEMRFPLFERAGSCGHTICDECYEKVMRANKKCVLCRGDLEQYSNILSIADIERMKNNEDEKYELLDRIDIDDVIVNLLEDGYKDYFDFNCIKEYDTINHPKKWRTIGEEHYAVGVKKLFRPL